MFQRRCWIIFGRVPALENIRINDYIPTKELIHSGAVLWLTVTLNRKITKSKEIHPSI
jgi:hypothetical protein